MQACVYVDPHRVETRQAPQPQLGPGDLLLRVHACGLCGTDIMKIRYGLPKAPVVLGHEVAGEVAGLGPDVTGFALGDRVVVAHHTPCYACHYCRHGDHSMCRQFKRSNLDPGGFAEFVRIPARHVETTTHKLGPELSYEQAIYMEPLACVLRNLKRPNLLPGDTALVIGMGAIGLMTGQVIQHHLGQVFGTDLRKDRRELGKQFGFSQAWDGQQTDIGQEIREQTQGRGVDLVVLTAGTPELYGEVTQYVRDGGSISIFAGLEPGSKVQYDLNQLYHRNLTVFSSYSASPEDLREALEYLRNGVVTVDPFKASIFGLNDFSTALDAVMSQKIFKAIIRPEGIAG